MKRYRRLLKILICFIILSLSLSMTGPVIKVNAIRVGPYEPTVEENYDSGRDKIIAMGTQHCLAIKQDGSLWAWGRNDRGQIGDGTNVDRSIPVKILDNVRSVDAGGNYSMAVLEDGSLWTWGANNEYSQLGDGTTVDKNKPVKIMDGVRYIAAGSGHAYVIKTDGSLWGWGYNKYGELGDNTFEDKTRPVKIMDDVDTVATDSDLTLAVKTDGSLWVWGSNRNGVLERITKQKTSLPVKIMDGIRDVDIDSHCLVVKDDGSLWTFGLNWYGECGNGTTGTLYSPPQKILNDVKSISASYGKSFAIQYDGSLYAWGHNAYGALGDGTVSDYIRPFRTMDNVIAVDAGFSTGMAVKEDGSLWTWGAGSFGQLGTGSLKQQLSPVKVMDGIKIIKEFPYSIAPFDTDYCFNWAWSGEKCLAISTSDYALLMVRRNLDNRLVSIREISSLKFSSDNINIVTVDNYGTLKPYSPGVAKISLMDDRGNVLDQLSVVVTDNKINFHISENIPNVKGKPGFTGSFFGVENYTVSDGGSNWNISMDIYNTEMAYGVVDVFDKDGNFISSRAVRGTKLVTSAGDQLFSAFADIPKLPDIFMAIATNSPSYRSVSSEINSIQISVPKGGYFAVTKSAKLSSRVLVANMVNYYQSLIDLMSNDTAASFSDILKETLKVQELSEDTLMIVNDKIVRLIELLDKKDGNLTYYDLAVIVKEFNGIYAEVLTNALQKLNAEEALITFLVATCSAGVNDIIEEFSKDAVINQIAGSVKGGAITLSLKALKFTYKLNKLGNFLFPQIELYKSYNTGGSVFVITRGW